MKFNRKLWERFLIALTILTPICFAIRIYVYWNEINPITGFYRGKNIGCLIFNIFAFAVFFLCLIFSLNKKGKSVEKKKRKKQMKTLTDEENFVLGTRESSEEGGNRVSFSGFERSVSSWEGTLSAFSYLFMAFTLVSFGVAILMKKENYSDYYKLALVALSFLSGLFFLAFTFRNSAEKSAFMGFFGLCPVFWFTLRLLVEYRDLTRFMNKGLYAGQFLFAIAALIFFLYQAQFILGDQSLLHPNSYAFSALSVLFFGLCTRVPHLFALLGDKFTMDLTDSTTLLVDLAITVFAAIKIGQISRNT